MRPIFFPVPMLLAALLLLQGCASGPRGPEALTIDDSVTAVGQSSRVRFVVIHYTVSDTSRALALLSRGEVSSHYLITDEEPPRVYRLVDENRSAWHAGQSAWRGYTMLNSSSIGIEIVNRGPTAAPDGGHAWQPYRPSQIRALEALLRGIVARHGIAPEDIVGHSDVAPLRKQDPGPAFPWRELAAAGLGRWYDAAVADALRARFEEQGLPDAAWVAGQLARLGYPAPRPGQEEADLRMILAAFQMHYRPARHDGVADAETIGILAALGL